MICSKCNTENPGDSKFCKECATPLPISKDAKPSFTRTLEVPVQELTRGTQFAGRYEIIEELGQGGMGKVYRAEDKKIQEEVALKLINPEISSDKKNINRFSNELKVARRIAHRNVCKMYELMEDKGLHFITMEYVSGEDLKSFIKRSRRLDTSSAIAIGKQVCEGLAEARRLGVVHRDLKPSNIMIDKEGNAKIMDFGIARLVKAKGITGAGIMIGTPEYMSPEQVEAQEVDLRSDIYSLGVVLYEMVTGQLPFAGETPLSIALKHKTETPTAPKELNPQISETMNQLILKCLEKDRENRYQSAEDVGAELDNIEKGLPTSEHKAPPKKSITSKEITVTFGLKKLLIPALLVVVMVLIGLIAWSPWSKKEFILSPTDKPSLAILPFENVSNDPSLDGWRYGISQLLITDLSQSKYLRVLDDNLVYGILQDLNLIDADKFSSQDLIEVAERGGIQYIVSGNLLKAGDNILITAKLQQPRSGKLLVSKEITCQDESEILKKSDEIAPIIKENLDISSAQMADDFDETLGSITSRSPEAYKYYIEGVKRYHLVKKEEAIPFLKKAIEIDPQFAMAYNYLNACSPVFAEGELEYLKKAFELSHLVSERERLQIQGDYYRASFPESEYPKAIEAYERLLEIYPDDNIGNRRLGVAYAVIDEHEKAYELWKVNIDNNSLNIGDYYNMACVYIHLGYIDEAIEVMELAAQRIPGTTAPASTLARIYLLQREYDLALEEADKCFLLDPQSFRSFWIKGDLYHLKGEWMEAESYYSDVLARNPLFGRDLLAALHVSQGRFEQAKDQLKQGIDLLEEGHWRRSNFLRRLGYIYLLSGDFDNALKACDDAWVNSGLTGPHRFTIQRRALGSKGFVHTRMGAMDKAQETADILKKINEEGLNKKAVRYSHFLEGLIELENKNYIEAQEFLNKACKLLQGQLREMNYSAEFEHALFHDSLASAYYLSGDLEKAEKEYQKILLLTFGRLYYGDIYAKSFYKLGRIYEQQGINSRALEHYEKFLELWKDADPGIAEVDDALTRAADFKGN